MSRVLTMACLGLLAGLAGCSSREAMPPVEGERSAVEAARVAQGARLAALGNCHACHTAPGGKPYAGGRALKTPFGTVYGTNITPDPETGIGRWSEAAFARAMREGIDREGRHLYPAFPYDYFTHLTDDDIGALYAFLMTRDPVEARTPANSIAIPRPLIAAWNGFYLRPGVFQPDASQSVEWNRGAYLSQSLAHCGGCHTPRNAFGAEKRDAAFSGGEAEGWHAPALDAASPSPVPWTREALFTYLRTGIADAHALAAGPMAEVVHQLARVPDDDLRAIAVYVAALDNRTPEERTRTAQASLTNGKQGEADEALARGKAVYAGACGQCHDRGRQAEGGALDLRLGTALTIPTSRNLARIIDDGILPPGGEPGPWMPAYAGAFTRGQLNDLLAYLRSLTGRPPWRDLDADAQR